MELTNIQSIKPKLDMCIHHMQLKNLDVCFITEIWTQHGNKPDYQYIRANLDTAAYNIMIHSRENGKGGGVAVIYRPHLHVKKYSFNEHTSFETITINMNITTNLYLLSTIYRAPYSSKQPVTMQTFLEEFPNHISSLLRSSRNVIILGDFNIPWNKPEHPDTTSMQEIWTCMFAPTHKYTNTQAEKYTRLAHKQQSRTIQDIKSKDVLSDHSIIEWTLQISQKVTEKMQTTRRDLSKINEESFMSDLKNNLEVDTEKTLQQNYNNYRDAIKKTIDKHAPMKTKMKTKKDQNPQFDQDAQRLKTQRRLAERRWLKSKQHDDLIEYKHINTIYKNTCITPTKCIY